MNASRCCVPYDSETKTTQRGKLYYKLTNIGKFVKTKSKPRNSDGIVPSSEEQQSLDVLRTMSPSDRNLDKAWKESFTLRQNKCRKVLIIHEYYENFPFLQENVGINLVNDFTFRWLNLSQILCIFNQFLHHFFIDWKRLWIAAAVFSKKVLWRVTSNFLTSNCSSKATQILPKNIGSYRK